MPTQPNVTPGTLWAFLCIAVLLLVASLAAVVLQLTDGFEWRDLTGLALAVVFGAATGRVVRLLRGA